MKNATIVGAGLVGSLWAVYLAKAGFKVHIFERRADMRKMAISAGKSINLATSHRGWKALDAIGIGDSIREIAIPMYGRTLHNIDNSNHFQPYGINNQAIFSVSRGAINSKLMDLAEQTGNVTISFNEECILSNLHEGRCTFRNTLNGAEHPVDADVVFATDGAFSAVRYHTMQKTDRFNYSQTYIEDGYREILLTANHDGTFKLDKNTLHIWPRGRFMLIALPNLDGTFTCTLFMPFEGHKYCFNNLKNRDQVNDFFKTVFPDFYNLMPEVGAAWDEHPLSSLAIIRCFPWYYGKTVLMGDAAHATVPFFGQGMNCGFEDCTIMWELMQKYGDNWHAIFEEYQIKRKPNGDAVQELSLQNYIVMRDRVTDPMYQLQQMVERRISELFPDVYFPLYSMVSFTDIEYRVALSKGNEQGYLIAKMIEENNITFEMPKPVLDNIIFRVFAPLSALKILK